MSKGDCHAFMLRRCNGSGLATGLISGFHRSMTGNGVGLWVPVPLYCRRDA